MSAEVSEVQAYAADCDECDWHGEFQEDRYDAERDAERHNEHCPSAERDDDPRTEREKFQDKLDDLAGQILGRAA